MTMPTGPMPRHERHPVSLAGFARLAWRQRDLIGRLAWREIVGRYRGAWLGLAWSFVTPLLMLGIYTFVFSVVFGARWGVQPPGGDEGSGLFAVVLFVGMMVFMMFAETVNRAPLLVVANTNYVKRVVFPLEILPLVVMLSSLFHLGVSLLIWMLAAWWMLGALPPTLALLPLVLAPLALGTLGLSWMLASLGVYLRDVAQTVGLATTALMFLAPVFFPMDALPPAYRWIVLANPLTFPIEQAREVAIWGRAPDWAGLGVYTLVSVLVASAGLWWFQKTRKGFADVL